MLSRVGAAPFSSSRVGAAQYHRPRKERGGKEREARGENKKLIQGTRTGELIREHFTEAFSDTMFANVRVSESQRKWFRYAVSRGRPAAVVEVPPSVSLLLQHAGRHSPTGLLPAIGASVQWFFSRAEIFNPTFCCERDVRFVGKVLPEAPQIYGPDIPEFRKRFTKMAGINGSRLDKIRDRVKVVLDEKAAVLPRALLAVYDIPRGIPSQVWFDSDAALSEFSLAILAVEWLEPGTLVAADRLYASPAFFRARKARSVRCRAPLEGAQDPHSQVARAKAGSRRAARGPSRRGLQGARTA